MSRYQFLQKNHIYDALDNLRLAFLAARDGNEVEGIIKGLLTYDERMKIGRRIAIAQLLTAGYSYTEIQDELKTSRNTIAQVETMMGRHPECYEYINRREKQVESTYRRHAYAPHGPSSLVKKPRVVHRI